MGEVHIRFVEDSNLPGPHARTHFVGPDTFVLAGGIHQCEARQEGMQVEPEMALGGGFAAAMFGPVQAAGDQLDDAGARSCCALACALWFYSSPALWQVHPR